MHFRGEFKSNKWLCFKAPKYTAAREMKSPLAWYYAILHNVFMVWGKIVQGQETWMYLKRSIPHWAYT